MKQSLFKILFICFIMISVFDTVVVNAQNVEIPSVEYVTVDHLSQKPIVVWSVNNPGDLSGFSIKRLIYNHPLVVDNSIQTIDTIYNSFLTSYHDFTDVFGEALPDERFEKYGIVAIDIVASDTFLSIISDYHQTLFLQSNFNFCKKKNELIWNRYLGWYGNFEKYEIYCSINSGSFNKIGELNSNNDTIFHHHNVNYNEYYEYYVIAVKNNGIESWSNISETTTQSINFPSYLYTDSLIVNSEKQIDLYFTIDNSADAEYYVLYKSFYKEGSYDSINNISVSGAQLNIEDPNFDFDQLNYYFLAAKDYCGNIIYYSDTVNNIFLTVQKRSEEDIINKLSWLDESTDKEYKIKRCIEENCKNINYTYLLNYEDNIEDELYNQFTFNTTSGLICYNVIASKDNYISKSNKDCIEQEERYFLANAFNPKSLNEENRIFKPKIAFVSDYNLTIYGSFGNIIFETSNPDEGWDGTLSSGKLAPRASYLYFLSFKNAAGEKIRKKEYVTLVY